MQDPPAINAGGAGGWPGTASPDGAAAAARGLEQLRGLIAAVKLMLSLVGYGGGPPDTVVERLAAAQRDYLALSAGLRRSVVEAVQARALLEATPAQGTLATMRLVALGWRVQINQARRRR